MAQLENKEEISCLEELDFLSGGLRLEDAS
jgi:hypothetical protein